MNLRFNTTLCLLAALLPVIPAPAQGASSYDGFRWFQIEVSIFSNEYPEYRNAELWTPDRLQLGYPPRSREFQRIADFLAVEDFAGRVLGNFSAPQLAQQAEPDGPGIANAGLETEDATQAVGPFPRKPVSELRLPDIQRTAYLLLPPSQSDFATTNTRLERSPVNRLLFHGAWRQPVEQPERARPLIVRGGRQFGDHHELEGTVTIRFNSNEDRVVIDTNLWLTEFTSESRDSGDWELPQQPGSEAGRNGNTGGFGINRIVQMRQSRDMRSTEFHYLDHPAMGMVISVLPYDLPPPVSPGSGQLIETVTETGIDSDR